MNRAFKERHDYIVAALNTLPGVSCRPASGAFYAFADVSKAIADLKLKDDNAFAEHLINTVGVAVVPGSGFGAPWPYALVVRLQSRDFGEGRRAYPQGAQRLTYFMSRLSLTASGPSPENSRRFPGSSVGRASDC